MEKQFKEDRILQAILTTSTQKEASEKAGVSEKTIQNYLKDSNFAFRLNEYSKKSIDSALIQLSVALNVAIDSLLDIAQDKETKAGDRIKACNSIIEHACRIKVLSKELEEQDSIDSMFSFRF